MSDPTGLDAFASPSCAAGGGVPLPDLAAGFGAAFDQAMPLAQHAPLARLSHPIQVGGALGSASSLPPSADPDL